MEHSELPYAIRTVTKEKKVLREWKKRRIEKKKNKNTKIKIIAQKMKKKRLHNL